MNYFTDYAIQIMEDLQKPKYEFLHAKYNEFVGNFQMTEGEMVFNIEIIKEWIMEHSDYFLVYQPMEEYEGADWFLTNFYE